MSASNIGLRTTGLLLSAVFSLTVNSAHGPSQFPAGIVQERIPWRTLSYAFDGFFGRVTTGVQLSTIPAPEASERLIPVPGDWVVQAPDPETVTIKVHSSLNPLFGSDEHLKIQSWCSPDSGAALQRVRLRQGNQKWQKSYRFTDSGVYRLRRKPADPGEGALKPDQWSHVGDAFYGYQNEASECRIVLEPNGLLYLISALEFQVQPFPVHVCVFNKKQLHRVSIFAHLGPRLDIDYLEKSGSKTARVQKSVDTIRFSFEPKSLAPTGTTPEDFSFLGLKGDFELFVDQDSGIPVRVSGSISPIGNVDILLRAVELKPRAD
ncbi:MAG: hypothetical protein GY703_02930 [Gammaproteobacteria bacterium]|nr:hypothetical protein [Gammaproteobacteria bacterium]